MTERGCRGGSGRARRTLGSGVTSGSYRWPWLPGLKRLRCSPYGTGKMRAMVRAEQRIWLTWRGTRAKFTSILLTAGNCPNSPGGERPVFERRRPMPWDDAAQLETSMAELLDEFNGPEADEFREKLVVRIHTDVDLLPERTAKILLQSLRRKRRFACMPQLAEALLQSGLRTPQIRRQYAQALIDQGILAAAEMILQSIAQDPQGIKGEELEARGLIGRIYKQLFV